MAKYVAKTAEDYRAAIAAIQKKADELTKGIARVSVKALLDVGLNILADAVDLAPWDTGYLRASAYMTVNGQVVAKGRGDVGGGIEWSGAPELPVDGIVEIKIGFNAPYAFIQHEHEEFDHPSKLRQKKYGMSGPDPAHFGQAKFLEISFDRNTAGFREYLLQAMRGGV